MPRRSHAGSTLRSGSRWSRLYSFCTLTNRAAPGLRRARRLVQLLGGEIRAADLPHLARLHQLVQRAERVGNRNVRIGLMQLVEVDVVGSEPFAGCPRRRG